MRDFDKFDITVKVCDFHTPSKSAGKIIDGLFMKTNVLGNKKWRDKLSRGQILGLFTHKGRQPQEQMNAIPYEDNIAISPYLCNVAKDVWTENDALYAGLDVFEDLKYGKILKDMLSRGMNVPVSMAVRATSDFQRFYVKDLLGVDFTFKPDLEAEVIQVNFSESGEEEEGIYQFSNILGEDDIHFSDKFKSELETMSYSAATPIGNPFEEHEIFLKPEKFKELDRLNFRYSKDETMVDGKIPVKIKDVSKLNNEQRRFISENDSDFSVVDSGPAGEDIHDISGSMFSYKEHTEDGFSELAFSLQQYIQELKLSPHQVLRKRIMEVIRWVSSNPQDRVNAQTSVLKAYIDTYMMKWVQDVLNHPEEKFNLIVGLRLTAYNINRKVLIDLQRSLNRTKQSLMSTAVMPPYLQKGVNHAFQSCLQGIYDYINEKCSGSGHRLK